MAVEVGLLRRAFTYAWWLTGDVQAAATAVRDATARQELRTAPLRLRLETVLRLVRAQAATEPTLSPAAEIALLHDGLGLDLDVAAHVAMRKGCDPTTLLAEGRLQALPATVRDLVHPERAGGLALGRPDDLDHARRCEDCGRLVVLLSAGRAEVVDLVGTVPTPPRLGALNLSTASWWPRVLRLEALDPRTASWWPRVLRLEALNSRTASPWRLALRAAAVLAVILALGFGLAAVAVDRAPTIELGQPAPPPAVSAQPASATAQGGGTFAVTDAHVEPRGPGSATVAASDPVRVALRYEHGQVGTTIKAAWTVDGRPFRTLRVVLASPAGEHVISSVPPPTGWPVGERQLVLSTSGSPLASVAFRVR